MRNYEDRVRRATNTPDQNGRFALWEGGMEPNIPVGSEKGIAESMKKAISGAEREQREGASGKWVAHWKMVHIIRPAWEKVGEDNQAGRSFPALTYTDADADGLVLLEPAPRTIRGARDLISVAMQYGNAFEQGFQAAALKPADFFGNDDVLYLMEDMATGEIRLSILWEWLHKKGKLTAADAETGAKEGDTFAEKLFAQLVAEEYDKLQRARNVDVHDNSKKTTLPLSRIVVDAYVRSEQKAPWMVDLLNINLGVENEKVGLERTKDFLELFAKEGIRITKNLDFA
jgi:malate synthase